MINPEVKRYIDQKFAELEKRILKVIKKEN